MSKNIKESQAFGWSYPAGAYSDPRAPWNEMDPEEYKTEANYTYILNIDATVETDLIDGDGRFCGTTGQAEDALGYNPHKMLEDLVGYIQKDLEQCTDIRKRRILEMKLEVLSGCGFELDDYHIDNVDFGPEFLEED